MSWTLGYNADDDITGITDNLVSANSQSLNYDVLNRLSAATGNYGNLGYSFDADGNRTQLNVNGVLTNYTYGASNNRLTKVNAIARSYDADGGTTHDGTYVYSYDDSERLTGVTKAGTTGTYQINALGQRAEKTVNGVSTVFIYDESGRLLGEYTPSGTLIAEHIWLNNRPIGVITSTGLYYVQTDQLDTPRAITNASNAIVWQWNSDPFGTSVPTGSLTYNLRFPGQYFDAETGHNYNYFRDYDPAIGRYMESDPAGLAGGFNTYTYTINNPITVFDRLGLDVYILGHIAASPGGLTTIPPSLHLALELQPNDPQDFSSHSGWTQLANGSLIATLGAQPQHGLLGALTGYFGNLVYAPNYQDDLFGSPLIKIRVSPPCGMTDTQFINALIHVAGEYQNNLPYALFPQIGSGTYNSNSFVAGILSAAGVTPPDLGLDNLAQVPGYSTPIPIP